VSVYIPLVEGVIITLHEVVNLTVLLIAFPISGFQIARSHGNSSVDCLNHKQLICIVTVSVDLLSSLLV